MTTHVRDEDGTISRMDTVDYICECFLDLVEEKPFYDIRVKELTTYAKLSRTTFYAHFGSVYDVAQRLEDDFLEGFYPEKIAFSVLLGGDVSDAMDQMDYVRRHARVMRLLGGTNGDPGFLARLERTVRRLCEDAWERGGSAYSQTERQFYGSYVAGGTVAVTRHIANDPEGFSPDDFMRLTMTVMGANDILLGLGDGRG